MASRTTALIVGASRGLGLALTEEWLKRDAHVIATVRTPSPELDALKGRYPGSLEIETVDIAEAGPVHALRKRLDGRRLDVLFINAGICKATEKTSATVDEQEFIDMMRTNALSPMRVVELHEDVVAPNGVIAVMTSELGSIAGNPGFWDLYSSSKAALNMLMKCFAARRAGDPRALLLVAPGWVRTDMGTSDAPLSIEESIPFVVETVERSRGKPGLRFIDRNGRLCPGEIDNKRKGRQSWIFRPQGSPAAISSRPAQDERCNPHRNGGLHVCCYWNHRQGRRHGRR